MRNVPFIFHFAAGDSAWVELGTQISILSNVYSIVAPRPVRKP